MKSSFFIVADRGNLKAFRAEKGVADRPPRLQQVQALSFVDAHSKVSEINTDADGRRGNSNGEKHYSLEADKRTAKQLASLIQDILKKEKPEAWSFAAPGEIKEAVVGQLPVELQRSLQESLGRDLVNVTTGELLGHFSGARAAA